MKENSVKTTSNDKKYSFVQNTIFTFSILFKVHPVMRLLTPARIVLRMLIGMLPVFTLPVVVWGISVRKDLKFYLLIILMLFMAQVVLNLLQFQIINWSSYYQNNVQNRTFLLKLLEKSLHGDYENVESPAMRRLLERASHAVNIYRKGASTMFLFVPTLIADLIGIVIYSLGISFIDWRVLLMIAVMTLVNFSLDRWARMCYEKQMDEQYKIWGRFFYLQKEAVALENGKDIRIYGMQDWFREGFDRMTNRNMELKKALANRKMVLDTANGILGVIRDLLAYGILIKMVLAGNLGIAEFTLGLGVVTGLSAKISALGGILSMLLTANANVREYRKYLDYPNAYRYDDGKPIPTRWKEKSPEIEFQNVSFRYEEDGEYILKNLSFRIRSGEKLALVGANGAGKTTLVKLLCGFYHCSGGRILIGGVDLEELNLNEWHGLLSTIFQDIEKLPTSIASNVSGKLEEETDLERVRECLRKAGLWEDVAKLKNREMTSLSQCFDPEGIELSGGMMQKLMLARCLYKDASFLIMDEPTAALDPIAESNMYESYKDIAKGKSALFISHRLASTKFCDRILYMENGRITEEGTHEELLARKGEYAKVFEIQSKYYKAGEVTE